MDDQLVKIAGEIAKVAGLGSGAGVFIIIVVKWFINKSLENVK